MAKGYLVVCYREIRDREKLKTYAELAPKAMLPRGANILVRDGRVTAFEDGLAERTVLVEFPSYDAAIEAFEGTEILPVPAALLGAGEHYALEVSGDSMVEAGILDGDFALIKRTETARDGEIVVALVRGEEATLKYLRRENGRIRLDPANASYAPQYYAPHEVQVQGKLAGLLRRYH